MQPKTCQTIPTKINDTVLRELSDSSFACERITNIPLNVVLRLTAQLMCSMDQSGHPHQRTTFLLQASRLEALCITAITDIGHIGPDLMQVWGEF